MEPLFCTEFDYNYNEFKKFMWRFSGRPLMILVCAYSLLLIFLGIGARNPLYITLGIALPVVFRLLHNFKIKRVYKSNRVMDKLKRVYKFYDTCFTVEDAKSNAKVEYKDIHKVVVTKTNVYLMIAKNQGFLLLRQNFPEGLLEHLTEIKQK